MAGQMNVLPDHLVAFGSGDRGGARRWSARMGRAVRMPLSVWAVHLLIVQVTASLAFRFGVATGSSGPQGFQPTPLHGIERLVVGPLRLWDGLWYTLIAEQGYANWSAKAAFWPLFPWLMHAGHALTGLKPETVGYLIANVSFAMALIALFQLVSLDFDEAVARRTLWAIALFPTSLFFSAVYTESLFLLFVVAALLAARQRRWWLAGGVGALAALTRSYGVFLGLPLLVLFGQQRGWSWRRWLPDGLALGLPALGPLIFGWRLHIVQGHWRAFIDVQNQWNRTIATPWKSLVCGATGCTLSLTQYGTTRQVRVRGAQWTWLTDVLHHPSWTLIASSAWRHQVADNDTLELACTALFLLLLAVGLRTLPVYYSAFSIPGLVVPLLSPSTVHPLMSVPRFGLALFPLFVSMALLIRGRRLAWALAGGSTVLLILLTVQFSTWYWVS